MKTRNEFAKACAFSVCATAIVIMMTGCASNIYTVELRNESPRLCKEVTLHYGGNGDIPVGYLDSGKTPYGTFGGKSETGELGPIPGDATLSWTEENGRKYQVAVKVKSVIQITNPDGTIVFAILPNRSVRVTYEPEDPRLRK